MKSSLLKIPIALSLLLASALAQAAPLTVAIAANLSYVFNDLATEFRKETGIEVQSVLGSSGRIAAQVQGGAPFDLFMSADMGYPESLFRAGYAVTPPRPYAYGLLVLWTEKGVDLSRGVAGLADASVGKVAIANPRTAPFGRQALKALEYYKVREVVEPKLVYGESITQANQYVGSRAVDVGFSAKSIVMTPEVAGRGTWVEVPAQSYQPIAQGMVILKHGAGTHGEEARKFYNFILSEKARAIFTNTGYRLP
jgi:molybdate transport system substrate-binding protein